MSAGADATRARALADFLESEASAAPLYSTDARFREAAALLRASAPPAPALSRERLAEALISAGGELSEFVRLRHGSGRIVAATEAAAAVLAALAARTEG